MIQGFEKPRILFFIGSLRAGGKERRLVELLTYLKEKDQYEILVVMTKNEIAYRSFYSLDITYHVIDKRWRKNDPTVFSKFFRICKQFKPHIIHSWGRMQSFYAIPVVIGQKTPLVNSQITGAPTHSKGWGMNKAIDLVNFRFSEVVLANSKAGFEAFKPPVKKRKLIFNGINLTRFKNLPPAEVTRKKYGINTSYAVVMAASYSPAKDYNLFYDVALQVTSKRDDISFIGVGGFEKDDSEFRRLRELASKNPRIIFHGQIQDVEALVNACTIGVLFSTNGEGTSNSILEYMALAKPVIANNAGGNRELVWHEKNGYLTTGETAGEIGKWIIDLVDEPGKREMFGLAGRKRIWEEFSLESMGKAFEAVYQDVLLHENVKERLVNPVWEKKFDL